MTLRRTWVGVASLLCIALLVYAVLTWGVMRRIALVFCREVHVHEVARWVPARDEDPIFGVRPSNVPGALKFGLAAALLSFPTWCLTGEILRRRRRYVRDRRGQCVDCGHPLTTWRGRCPGCGTRIGPD